MPYMCSVPRCNGNYKSGPKVNIFAFPNDDDLKEKWIRAIKRKDLIPTKNSRVDMKFFYILWCLLAVGGASVGGRSRTIYGPLQMRVIYFDPETPRSQRENLHEFNERKLQLAREKQIRENNRLIESLG